MRLLSLNAKLPMKFKVPLNKMLANCLAIVSKLAEVLCTVCPNCLIEFAVHEIIDSATYFCYSKFYFTEREHGILRVGRAYLRRDGFLRIFDTEKPFFGSVLSW